jgi:pimeloyl-ACP methyl ester carboxylesterase
LQGEAEYERRAARSLEMEEQEHHQLYPLLTLRSSGRCSAGGPACPLLIGLHANSGTAQDSLEFWQAAAASGWLVAAPQSSQALWKGAYVWNDRQICEEEITRHYRALINQYAIDPARVVIAGHSMGGEMALWLTIQGILPVKGFIAIGPGGPLMDDVENWTAMLRENPQRKLRGYLIFGQEDKTIPQENIRLLAEILNQAGIITELEEAPDLGHDFAQEYAESLLRGLNFIDQS